jgi:hypothetical protein
MLRRASKTPVYDIQLNSSTDHDHPGNQLVSRGAVIGKNGETCLKPTSRR